MAPGRKKTEKPSRRGLKRLRNPFAGRPRGGAGYHSDKKYGKKDRWRQKKQAQEEMEEG
ncbi:MAG: hypothetical protein IBX61_02080 [Thermoleophilia bacterium]|nr:hypothetical protein [Thermoleophilia bacterium]